MSDQTPTKQKDSFIIFQVTPELKESIKVAAKESKRSVSNYLRCIIEDAITNKTKV